MAKLSSDPISATDIAEYMDTQDDFTLELNVYHFALELGLSATHGGSYRDPVTGKTRQFDVRLALRRDNTAVGFAVECKALKPSFPLVVSTIPRNGFEAFHNVVVSIRPHQNEIADPLSDPAETVRVSDQGALYPIGHPVGKSTVQVGRTDKGDLTGSDSDVFDKWSQALASLKQLGDEAIRHFELSSKHTFATALLPVLVVPDGALWSVSYDEDGSRLTPPQPCNFVPLYVGSEYTLGAHTPFVASHLHIYTLSGFKNALRSLQSEGRPWRAVFPHGAIARDERDA